MGSGCSATTLAIDPRFSRSRSVSASSSTGLETKSLRVCRRTGPTRAIKSVRALSKGNGLTLPCSLLNMAIDLFRLGTSTNCFATTSCLSIFARADLRLLWICAFSLPLGYSENKSFLDIPSSGIFSISSSSRGPNHGSERSPISMGSFSLRVYPTLLWSNLPL